jgi:hypothetical protein
VSQPTITHTPTDAFTSTPTDTPVAPTPTDTSVTPTPTDTPVTPTPTDTPVTPTPTDTPVTPTPTDTPITPTPTDTPITPTLSPTPEPTQIPLPPGVNIGPPDGSYYEIGCGNGILVDLGSQMYIGRLAYYEVEDPANPGYIALDWVIVYVGSNFDGPWTLIFYWGDTDSGNNGDIPSGYYPPEVDNQPIGMNELYNGTGIRIFVAGTYRYVWIASPPGCGDPAQVDGIEVLP